MRIFSWKFFNQVLAVANLINLLLIGLGFADSLWIFFLMGQFRVEYVFVSLALLLVFGATKQKLNCSLAALGLILNFIGMQAQVFIEPATKGEGTATLLPVRILEMNVNYINTNVHAAEELICKTKADIVVIEELTPTWLTALGPALSEYSHKVVCPRPDTYGNGVFSKFPLENARIAYFGQRNHPTIKADVLCPGAVFSLVHTHLQGPVSPRYFKMHRDDADGVASLLKESKDDAVLCGDMNSASWCAPLRAVVREAGMSDSRASRGLQLSWPTIVRSPVPLLAIDHCFVRGSLVVSNREIGSNFGSDHFPVIIDLKVPTQTKETSN